MGQKVARGGGDGGVVAHIDGVGAVAVRVGQGGDQPVQRVAAPGQQAEGGAVRRVVRGQRGANAAGGDVAGRNIGVVHG